MPSRHSALRIRMRNGTIGRFISILSSRPIFSIHKALFSKVFTMLTGTHGVMQSEPSYI